jgi:plasmid stabilization system protein ParE
MKYDFSDLALRESNAVAAFINSRRPGSGDRYLRDLRMLVERLCRLPRICERLRNSHGREVRRAYLYRFKYIVDYQVFDDKILVLAITYALRKRTPWRKRMI